MNVVSLAGGLGNQMFQYAFGLLLPGGAVYDLSWFDAGQAASTTPRKYGLGCFNCEPPIISEAELERRSKGRPFLKWLGIGKPQRLFVEWPRGHFNAESLRLRNRLIHGYFQVARYYEPLRDRLRSEFTLRSPPAGRAWEAALTLARQENSISVHVRRGDYLKLPDIYPICGLDYYERAAEMMRARLRNAHFLVFSDDLDWAKGNLSLPGPTAFIDLGCYRREELDMMLMCECKHNIIANSTYSWWGGWLNRNPSKIVIAPRGKFSVDQQELVPDDWMQV